MDIEHLAGVVGNGVSAGKDAVVIHEQSGEDVEGDVESWHENDAHVSERHFVS